MRNEIPDNVMKYAKRALTHPRGKPDKIFLTVEALSQMPEKILALPLMTVDAASSAEAERIVISLLKSLDISETAIQEALAVIHAKTSMRGAALIRALSGKRTEPDRERGVRVSMLGIGTRAGTVLSGKLAAQHINIPAVKEALVLASKVASCKDIVAELCVSDDPDYTTGYVASRKFGYIRIPCIKKVNSLRGGRVFFLREEASPCAVITYLEKTPAMVTKIGVCRGVSAVHEITGHHNI